MRQVTTKRPFYGIKHPLYFYLAGTLFLAGCAGQPKQFEYKDLPQEVAAIKADGGFYKVGKPYKIMGQSYSPAEDYAYSETGMASWYGDDFHNKRTANGETYNMRAITAAHRTLPLPSVVRVTNLENGKSIIARVNDRGPYVKNRIIDVSQKGAELLGYKNKGIAKVRVDIMKQESIALKEAMLSKNNISNTYRQAMSDIKSNPKTIPPQQPYELTLSTPKEKPYTSEISVTAQATPQPTVKGIALPQSEKGPYFIQVGAFADYDKAKKMANNMKRFGNTSIFEAYLSKDGIYRVRLGGYNNKDEALKILDRVVDYGHSDVTLVKD